MSDAAVEVLDAFKGPDLNDLCDATDAAILDGGGFGWVRPPERAILERYWRGVLLVPERILFVGRLDGVIAGTAQMVKPSRNNEAQSFACQLTSSFVAPWARGHGLAGKLVEAVEARALADGFTVLNLDVRETQHAALRLFERMGYRRWGTHPAYAQVTGRVIAGHYYWKALVPLAAGAAGAGPGR